jgi:hypothetical protein
VQAPQSAFLACPQLSVPPAGPHTVPTRAQKAASVSDAQAHTFAVPPPPHVWGALQVPHAATREMPQLSPAENEPQFLP